MPECLQGTRKFNYYLCWFSDDVTSSTDCVCVFYYTVKPMITVAPTTLMNITNIGSVTFQCKALGSPAPNIIWTVQNQNVISVSCKNKVYVCKCLGFSS